MGTRLQTHTNGRGKVKTHLLFRDSVYLTLASRLFSGGKKEITKSRNQSSARRSFSDIDLQYILVYLSILNVSSLVQRATKKAAFSVSGF